MGYRTLAQIHKGAVKSHILVCKRVQVPRWGDRPPKTFRVCPSPRNSSILSHFPQKSPVPVVLLVESGTVRGNSPAKGHNTMTGLEKSAVWLFGTSRSSYWASNFSLPNGQGIGKPSANLWPVQMEVGGGVPNLSIQFLFFSWSHSHVWWGTPPRRVTQVSLSW